jgi:predicted enzyme related to lactoylglutathione lyase
MGIYLKSYFRCGEGMRDDHHFSSLNFKLKIREYDIMKIKLTSVFVDDQTKALKVYTEVLGFVKRSDITHGKFRWLTVVSPEEPEGTQLLLEPNDNPAAKTYQESIYKQGIPAAMFFVDDLEKEYERLKKLGVAFTMPPTKAMSSRIAVLEDTCGNLIQMTQLG